MKKLFPYILIVFIVVQMLMPFTVGVGVKNNLEVKSNKAEAVFGNGNDISLSETPSKTDKTITINFSVAFSQKPARLTKEGVRITKTDPVSGVADVRTFIASDLTAGGQDANGFYTYTNTEPVLFENLTPNKAYPITAEARQINTVTFGNWLTLNTNFTTDYWLNTEPIDGVLSILPTIVEEVTTNPEGIQTPQTQATKTAQTNTSPLPSCGIAGIGGTIPGCVAQIFYYVLFIPTSYVFALAGTFFDFTFHYSIQSSSYNTPFVVQGWGIVRDFCNMFFIFVLLYIAFGTILNLHGVNTKEMIINVVIIGLLINFSLFATQVIIDASNILAGVFYNSNSIRITQTDNAANGVQDTSLRPKLKIGPNGEIPLSEAIVNKVNPQNLIINASKSVAIQDKYTGENTATDQTGSLGAGAFIIITLLAVAVNVVGIITFLSVGLIFVTRVIGLWLAMILSPFAFFSYTVPALQDMEMVGWKKWWPETIKLAFLAPVFIFFMYLIIAFLDKGLSLISSNQTTDGMTFVIYIIIPFVFIMLLLIQAKNIAKSMSGKLGQSITNGIAAVGGMALGGAALGAAALGRGTIGAFMKGASTGDTAAQRLAAGDPTLSGFGKFKGRLQQMSGIDWAQQRVGARLNANQAEIGLAAHSRHQLDTAAGVVAPGKKWSELNGDERKLARTNLERANVMRDTPGVGNLTYAQLSTALRTTVDAAVATRVAANTTVADRTLIPQARRKVGLGENLIQSTVGGSFDIRNISKLIAGEQDKGLNKFITGTTSALASSMRGVLKQTNINYGTGQKDFIKDLGHTITEALKSTTLKVDLSHVGEEKKEEGGGGHH